jgi:hypothetical protein
MQRMNGLEIWSGPRGIATTGVRAHKAITIFGSTGWSYFLDFLDTDNTTSLFRVDQFGNQTMGGSLTQKPAASATPASNGQMVFELTSNTTLKVKVKGSDGTVRSATLTLA